MNDSLNIRAMFGPQNGSMCGSLNNQFFKMRFVSMKNFLEFEELSHHVKLL